MRSLLFVPGDSGRKFARARTTAADGLILDLEDSVAHDRKDVARAETREMLDADRGRQSVFVRVNSFDSGGIATDLAAIMSGRPDGIVLPKCASPDQTRRLGHMLDALEALFGITTGTTRILPIVTETADSLFTLGGYKEVPERLCGLMWGAEDLAASLGATANREADRLLDPYRLARSLCLAAASAAGVIAVDTVSTDIDDVEAVRTEARAARRDGFLAKAVIHPRHVDVINDAFQPSPAEIAWAKRVCNAFGDTPHRGAIRIDGKMVDKPHVRAAERLLASLRT